MSTTAHDLITGLDPDSDGFWSGIEAGAVHLRRCEVCDTRFVLPLPACPQCGSDALTTIESSGRGSLYSWVVVHHAFEPGLETETPYVIGAVELDERARIFARVEGVALAALAPDLRLVATFPTEPGRPPVVFVPDGGDAS